MCDVVEIIKGACKADASACKKEIASKYGEDIGVENCKCEMVLTYHTCSCQIVCPSSPWF